MSTLSELDCARSVRSASATVGPSAESPAGDRKSATITVSCAPKAPLPRSDAAGPMPNARLTMNPTTSTANAPTAKPPPIQVRRHDTWGLALSARVASVPWARHASAGRGCGVVANARYAVRWTKAVIPMTGSPASITPSEPGNTQSGRPMTSVAAQAVTPTARSRPPTGRAPCRSGTGRRAGPPAPPPRSRWW